MDTHTENYLFTHEGKLLPIKHCVSGTKGWQLVEELAKVQAECNGAVYYKPTFASLRLAEDLRTIHKETPIKEIELIGLCTDVCVVSNALLLKAYMPEVPIYVDASCCAGITPEKHMAALQTMESCHIMQRDLAFIWLTKGQKPKRGAFYEFKNKKLKPLYISVERNDPLSSCRIIGYD